VRQVVTQPPVRWLPAAESPEAILGDRRWANYEVGVDVRLTSRAKSGSWGAWATGSQRRPLRPRRPSCGCATRAAGSSPSAPGTDGDPRCGRGALLGVHAWHRLELAFAAATVTARIDGTEVASRTGHGPAHGEVGIGLGGYDSADFDNLLIAPTS
jgi:hypothetical protein